MRKERAKVAQETLNIIQTGEYVSGNKLISVKEEVQNSIESSKLYSSIELENLEITLPEHLTNLEVHQETTLQGTERLLEKGKVGVLNFASAKNPGGGFKGGSQAQEESIARSSSLYPCISQMSEMYDFNRKQRTYLYSDYMIYSKDVVVFRDDDMNLLNEPYVMDVITSPAVNEGAILQNKPSEQEQVEETMKKRLDYILSLFVHHKIDNIVLGAWGCGVFRNSPNDVAEYFSYFLQKGGKYESAFKNVRFSILDRSGKVLEVFKNKLLDE